MHTIIAESLSYHYSIFKVQIFIDFKSFEFGPYKNYHFVVHLVSSGYLSSVAL